MDSNTIELLSGISVGQAIIFFSSLIAIIAAFCTATLKIYKLFDKYRNAKEENERIKKASEEHEAKFEEFGKKLDTLVDEIEKQRKINYKQVRYEIVLTCEDAISCGRISANKLRSLMEMYDEYTRVFADLHPNGYVHTLMTRVQDPTVVEIVGKSDT